MVAHCMLMAERNFIKDPNCKLAWVSHLQTALKNCHKKADFQSQNGQNVRLNGKLRLS